MKPPSSETVTLDDGTPLVIRPIAPEDREGLRRGFAETSAETRLLRFGLASETLSERALDYLTCVDQEDHVALVATLVSPDLKDERGVGVARFVRSLEEPSVAEAAVTVVDDMQHRGVGRALTRALARAALDRGVTRLRANVLLRNQTMVKILEHAGARPLAAQAEGDPNVAVYELPLREPPRGL